MHCQTMTGFILKISENVFESRDWHYFSFHKKHVAFKGLAKISWQVLVVRARNFVFHFAIARIRWVFKISSCMKQRKMRSFVQMLRFGRLSTPTPQIVYLFFSFAKQIANTVCSQAMWMKQNFKSENKHLKRTKTNKMIFLNIQIKCVFFCFSEFMSTLFKWQRSFQKSKAIERGAVDLSCGHFAWKHMLSFKMEIRRC